MNWFSNLYRTAVGKKAVMAVTGILFWGFVVAHMVGNLKALLGAQEINHYAEWLRHAGEPAFPPYTVLWLVRLVLVGALALHFHAYLTLTRMSQKARPVDYARREVLQAGWPERTMRWTGVLLLLFVVYHLFHFTFGTLHNDFVPGDVFHNLVSAFHLWWVLAIYVVAMGLVGFHLYHGLWSLFQSLGWSHPRFNHWRRTFAVTFAILVPAGFVLPPILVFLRVLG